MNHGSASALLFVRFGIALSTLLLLGLARRRWLPAPGTRRQVAATGLLIIGGYSLCYFEAMSRGITPGLLATLLGIQPILTLFLIERRFSPLRLAGLLLALGGLMLVVYQSLVVSGFDPAGMLLAFGALASMTVGAILQKRVQQPPSDVLPLQYAVALAACLVVAPFHSVAFERSLDFFGPAIWLGLIVSVVAQLLLYRLIRRGNLVNVTSLFYLVPAVTALLDYLLLGNLLPRQSIIGMVAILAGVALVFRHGPASK
ncbi:MAG: DMT family transporter [Alphaproteobacteria bacterium]